jgi:hypothetical protein
MIKRVCALASALLFLATSSALAHDDHAPPPDYIPPRQPYYKGLRNDYHAGPARWWKGNTHTHTWWSDGDSPAENAAAWYREHGYNFLVLSDHNRLQQDQIARGEKALHYSHWYPVDDEARQAALEIYRQRFGRDWVQERVVNDVTEVRLRPLDEFRHLFEVPGEFAFIGGEEVTDRFERHPLHMNAVNVQEVIAPRGGATPTQVIQNNLDAVLDEGVRSGRKVLAHINHPNFRYAITIEDLLALDYDTGEGYFELYNGHHGVENYGDPHRPGLERMWDVLLSKRLAEGDGALLYGVANDDAHSFTHWTVGENANPGRGWVMVRATRLTPDAIVDAMKRGEFYASTGVSLRSVERAANTLAVSVEPEPGVEYTIEFIGTRRGTDLNGRAVKDVPADLQGRISRRYSEDIGVVLKTARGTDARYSLKRDDLYVRARITSTRLHPNPFRQGDTEMAWTQPLANKAGH